MRARKYRELYRREEKRFLAELMEVLRIASVSAHPTALGECQRCAQWFNEHLKGMGLRSEMLSTKGKPVVLAELEGGERSAPTVVFYGHYDVQPSDPLEKWVSDPFQPEVREGRVFARGAQDNKGQVMFFLKALESVIQSGAPYPHVKIILEGEEEVGSSSLQGVLRRMGERLSGDVLIVCDTLSLSEDRPLAVLGLRGILAGTLKLAGLSGDLHSGFYGGLVLNPAEQIARLVSCLHEEGGKVLVPGFYDGVKEPTTEQLELLAGGGFDAEASSVEVGVPLSGGERQYPPEVRVSLRPTLEINGVHSGYGGEGMKTVIPAEALAKFSVRLVAGQDPERIKGIIENYLKERAPEDLRFSCQWEEGGSGALSVSASSRYVALARESVREALGAELQLGWQGASIPILSELVKLTKNEAIMVGFGLPEDRIHAPNESFSLGQFERGFLYAAVLLERLADVRGA